MDKKNRSVFFMLQCLCTYNLTSGNINVQPITEYQLTQYTRPLQKNADDPQSVISFLHKNQTQCVSSRWVQDNAGQTTTCMALYIHGSDIETMWANSIGFIRETPKAIFQSPAIENIVLSEDKIEGKKAQKVIFLLLASQNLWKIHREHPRGAHWPRLWRLSRSDWQSTIPKPLPPKPIPSTYRLRK